PERRTPQHVFAPVEPDQVGEVRMAVGKLGDLHRAASGETIAKPRRQPRGVGRFPGTDRAGVVEDGHPPPCFLSSIRAIVSRWTSSGPSKIRSARAWTQAAARKVSWLTPAP